MSGELNRIPNFVKARKPNRLRVLMLEAQVRTGYEFEWKIIFNTEDKFWYGWFTEKVEVMGMTEGLEDG